MSSVSPALAGNPAFSRVSSPVITPRISGCIHVNPDVPWGSAGQFPGSMALLQSSFPQGGGEELYSNTPHTHGVSDSQLARAPLPF